MIRLALSLLLVACLEPPPPEHSGPPALEAGAFSRLAAGLSDPWSSAAVAVIRSPDGKSTARVAFAEDGDAVMTLSGAIGEGTFKFIGGPNDELLWAPDSRALFVTENDGGIVGSYRLLVFGRYGGKLVRRDLTPVVAKAFRQPGKCFDGPEAPNVAGLAWAGSSRRVVAIGETLPHSECDYMGTFSVYEVDLDRMAVVARYGQIEAKARFGDALGERPTQANDDCFRKPGTCLIPQLHPELAKN